MPTYGKEIGDAESGQQHIPPIPYEHILKQCTHTQSRGDAGDTTDRGQAQGSGAADLFLLILTTRISHGLGLRFVLSRRWIKLRAGEVVLLLALHL